MVINGKQLLERAPIADMETTKKRAHGVSYGLAEVGYDIRIADTITLDPSDKEKVFTLAHSMERFQMPNNLVGIVHDKSTWARKGVSVFNTVIEPSWHGYLTLEISLKSTNQIVTIPEGAGIAQIIFHEIAEPAHYNGKYQNQPNRPVEAILE